MVKIRKKMEFDKVIRDAWSNLDSKGKKLKHNVNFETVQESS